MSDTPRTDAIMRLHRECMSKLATPANEYALKARVSELERELSTARAECERLRQRAQDAEADAVRLNNEKVQLWEEIHFPGGWKQRAESAEAALRDAEQLLLDARNGWRVKAKELEADARRYLHRFAHIHVNNGTDTACKSCMLDLRDPIHSQAAIDAARGKE